MGWNDEPKEFVELKIGASDFIRPSPELYRKVASDLRIAMADAGVVSDPFEKVIDMYDKMPCGNTQAEIDNDTDTEGFERARYEAEEANYVRVLNELLEGKSVQLGLARISLAQRLADQYQEFADFVDIDFDYMYAYRKGELSEPVNNLIRTEAKVLASIIVG